MICESLQFKTPIKNLYDKFVRSIEHPPAKYCKKRKYTDDDYALEDVKKNHHDIMKYFSSQICLTEDDKKRLLHERKYVENYTKFLLKQKYKQDRINIMNGLICDLKRHFDDITDLNNIPIDD